jgi:sterol desaturase/sphingolipid hydroxylase (fatty acid hydroxylase superfamily)
MLAMRGHLHESFRDASQRDARALDLGFWLWDALALNPLFGLLLFGLLQVWPQWIGEPLGESQVSCALLIQAGVAVWLGDGLASLRHRIEHTRFFWRWHAWHHQVNATDWIGTHRHHPLSRVLGFVLEGLLLLCFVRILFGHVSWPAIVGSLALRRAWAIWLHSGSTWGMRCGIGRFVVLPVHHRMHHSGAPIYAGLFHHWDAVWAALFRPRGPRA